MCFKFSFRLMLRAKVKSLLFARQPTSPAPSPPLPNDRVAIWRKGNKTNAKICFGRCLFVPTASPKTMTYQGEMKRLLSPPLSPPCHPSLRPFRAPQFASLPRGQWQLSLQFCNQLRLKVKFSQAQWGKGLQPDQNATPCIIVQVGLNGFINTN